MLCVFSHSIYAQVGRLRIKSTYQLVFYSMSKDYQERVEDLSDQLQEIKKQKRKSLSPKKERAPSPVKETCTIEQHRHFYGENAHLKLQVHDNLVRCVSSVSVAVNPSLQLLLKLYLTSFLFLPL